MLPALCELALRVTAPSIDPPCTSRCPTWHAVDGGDHSVGVRLEPDRDVQPHAQRRIVHGARVYAAGVRERCHLFQASTAARPSAIRPAVSACAGPSSVGSWLTASRTLDDHSDNQPFPPITAELVRASPDQIHLELASIRRRLFFPPPFPPTRRNGLDVQVTPPYLFSTTCHCPSRPETFPKLNVVGSNPISRSQVSRRLMAFF
jgi:hypothetical protein